MSNQHITLLVCQAVAWLVVFVYLARALLKSREEKYQYKLYALRDKLIYLVASDRLSEDSLVFKAFYGAITNGINEINRLTIYSLIRASLAAKSAIQKEKQVRLRDAIEHSNPDTREFVNDFACTMMSIMMNNSPLLRLMLWTAHRCGQFLAWLRRFVSVPNEPYELYKSYRYFENIHAIAR